MNQQKLREKKVNQKFLPNKKQLIFKLSNILKVINKKFSKSELLFYLPIKLLLLLLRKKLGEHDMYVQYLPN